MKETEDTNRGFGRHQEAARQDPQGTAEDRPPCEGDVVASHIRLGHHLAELRALAERNWGKQLKAIGISPRVASRYLKIAEHWPNEIGLNESDLLPRLPLDLLKLEWLCRVPLAHSAICWTNSTARRPPAPRSLPRFARLWAKTRRPRTSTTSRSLFSAASIGWSSAVDRLPETFPEPEQQDRARELLAAGLRQVQDPQGTRAPGTDVIVYARTGCLTTEASTCHTCGGPRLAQCKRPWADEPGSYQPN